MGLDAVLRDGIALLDSETKTLQGDITHEAWIGQDGFGDDTFDTPVTLKGVVEPMHKMMHLSDGRQVLVRAKVIIMQIVAPNGASGRMEPIDRRDKLTLPDGFSGPIVDIVGVTDPSTNRPYHNEILIGDA